MSTTSAAPCLSTQALLALAQPARRHTGFPGIGFDDQEAVRAAVTARPATRDGLPCSIVREVRGEELEFTVELDLRDDGVILSGFALVLADERTQDGQVAFAKGSRVELTLAEFSDAQKRRPYRTKTFAQFFGYSREAGERLSDFI